MKNFKKNNFFDLSYPCVMGIINVTPDSFSGDGIYKNIPKTIDFASNMIKEGAKILDIGGESTKPGAHGVKIDEEIDRVIPAIVEIKKRFDILISINTSKAIVMKEGIKSGVDIINDIHSFSEPETFSIASSCDLPICIMHMKGEPKTMQNVSIYSNLLLEIKDYFSHQIFRFESFGVKKDRLILDPGFGFGKNTDDNYKILSNLKEFSCFNLPILVGFSRKSMIGELIHCGPQHRLYGSVSCAVIAALHGAKIIRSHDVKATVEALRIVKSVLEQDK